MENFERDFETAKKKIYLAEYMLTNTYALLKDPKLLLAILENIQMSLEFGLNAILGYERIFRRIPPFHNSLDSKINTFKLKVQKRLKFDDKCIKIILKISDILNEHKNSSVEFSRNKKYVIANDAYNLKTISVEDLKENINICKDFLNKINQILGDKNDA
jgi:hypothetical protein